MNLHFRGDSSCGTKCTSQTPGWSSKTLSSSGG